LWFDGKKTDEVENLKESRIDTVKRGEEGDKKSRL